jgi:hypothetical protein
MPELSELSPGRGPCPLLRKGKEREAGDKSHVHVPGLPGVARERPGRPLLLRQRPGGLTAGGVRFKNVNREE